jgi:hypothetical protein
MESSENASDVPLATVMPWILLYRIIQRYNNGLSPDLTKMRIDCLLTLQS